MGSKKKEEKRGKKAAYGPMTSGNRGYEVSPDSHTHTAGNHKTRQMIGFKVLTLVIG